LTLDAMALPPGGALRYAGGTQALVCDRAWKEVARVPVATGPVRIGPGDHTVAITSLPQPGGKLAVELSTLGPSVALRRPAAQEGGTGR
jgi:hypothetical protein